MRRLASRRARMAQLALVLGFALLIAAPTPGAVGSCGGDELDGEADVVSYCQEREQLVCERKRRRGELTDDGAQTCRHQVIECKAEALCSIRSSGPASLDAGASE